MAINKFMQAIFQMPLYEKMAVNEAEEKTLTSLLDETHYDCFSVDLYCTECKAKSIFNPSFEEQIKSDRINSFAFFKGFINFAILHYRCARDKRHYLCAQILLQNQHIIKIGQYPAKADIEFPEFDRFSKILPREKLGDLKRSLGLASHGIGAGSFVYLRRVFEFLMNTAHEHAVKAGSLSEEHYMRSRVVERIRLLKDFLPSFMVDNAQAYGILSKGVHELSEDECLESYELMKDTIELILDEILARKEKMEKEKKLKQNLLNLHSNLAETGKK